MQRYTFITCIWSVYLLVDSISKGKIYLWTVFTARQVTDKQVDKTGLSTVLIEVIITVVNSIVNTTTMSTNTIFHCVACWLTFAILVVREYSIVYGFYPFSRLRQRSHSSMAPGPTSKRSMFALFLFCIFDYEHCHYKM